MSDAAVAGLFALGGVAMGALFEFARESISNRREQKRYAREQRTQAFLDWLTAISQMTNAIVDHYQAALDRQTGKQTLTTSEVQALRSHVDRIRLEKVRPALNHVRLFASSEIIQETRRAGRCLREADEAYDESTNQEGQLNLHPYREAHRRCLELMRRDLGTAAANDQLELGGGADRPVVAVQEA